MHEFRKRILVVIRWQESNKTETRCQRAPFFSCSADDH